MWTIARTHARSGSGPRSCACARAHVRTHPHTPARPPSTPCWMLSPTASTTSSTSSSHRFASSSTNANANPNPHAHAAAHASVLPTHVPHHHLRRSFLDYFSTHATHPHRLMPSASLVPAHDPSLLFTNAGMVPFKDHFLGVSAPPASRLTSAQRCLRAGGKHNDLDNVGMTARHHTLFEMLGNFSFGDYFKEQAMHLAWTYLTRVLQLPPERLRVTVLHSDNESRAMWRRVAGLTDDRIVSMGEADNFWSMGDEGPCGPCSEIYWDQQRDVDGERWVEVWNLVFMQFDRQRDGTLLPLAQPCVDTGMGLERLAAVLQNAPTNFDTDVFRSMRVDLHHRLAQLSSVPRRAGESKSVLLSPQHQQQQLQLQLPSLDLPFPANDAVSSSMKVILDHMRAIVMLLFDGVQPAATGRGYVLRRILRRAVTHAHSLGVREPFLYQLFPAVAEAMGDAVPELRDTERGAAIVRAIRAEEALFHATLERGMRVLHEGLDKSARGTSSTGGGGSVLSGDVAFHLYDSCGFPLDLTEMVARSRGIQVDHARFDTLMAEQRSTSLAHWSGSGDSTLPADVRAWKSRGVSNTFTGYRVTEEDACRVVAVSSGDDAATSPAAAATSPDASATSPDASAWLVIDPCPFYATGGGQVADVGTLHVVHDRAAAAAAPVRVVDCTKLHDNCVAIRVQAPPRVLALLREDGALVRAQVASETRQRTSVHHTATHLLHAALRRELELRGVAVSQAGSHVDAERLRFDFSCAQAVGAESLERIEQRVNEIALQALPVHASEMPKQRALAELNAVALFSEKYGDVVRVVDVPGASTELCGGTHAANTSLVYPFKILSDVSISAGVRRIEAVAGASAIRLLLDEHRTLQRIAQTLHVAPADAEEHVQKLTTQQSSLVAQVRALKKRLAGKKGWPCESIAFRAEVDDVGAAPVPVKLHQVPVSDAEEWGDLRADANALCAADATSLHVLLCPDNGMCLVAAPTKAIAERVPAKDVLVALHAASANAASANAASAAIAAQPLKGGGSAMSAQGVLVVVQRAAADGGDDSNRNAACIDSNKNKTNKHSSGSNGGNNSNSKSGGANSMNKTKRAAAAEAKGVGASEAALMGVARRVLQRDRVA